MAHQYSLLDIMNAALVSVGLDEIVSDSDGTPEFRTMSRNIPGIAEAELEAGLYEFSRGQAHLLSRIPGKFGKADGYLIPGDALFVRHLWLNDSGPRCLADWSSDGEAVYVDAADGCFIEYLSVPDASVWSANFSKGVQFKLEAVLHRMMSDARAADDAEMRAVDAFQTGRTVAAKSRAARPFIREGSLGRARFGRG